MSDLRYWATSVAGDMGLLAVAILWKVYGLEGAGDAFLFFVWVGIVFRFLLSLALGKPEAEVDLGKRPPGFSTYHACTEILMIGFLAWHGYIVTAVFYVSFLVAYEGARNEYMKRVKP